MDLIIKRKQEAIIEACNWINLQVESIKKEIIRHKDNESYPLGDYGYANEKLQKTERAVSDIRKRYGCGSK